MSEHPSLRKFLLMMILFLCFCISAPEAGAQGQSEALWQKIEDARAYMSSNKFPESRRMFEQALQMAIAEKDQTAEAICIGNLGTLCDMTDNYKDAIAYYKQGYELAEKQRNKVLMSKFAGCLVRKYAQQGDVKKARKWLDLQESLPIPDDPSAMYYNMYDKASVLLLEKDPVLALHYLDKARRYAEDHDLGYDMTGAALMGAGEILYKSKRYDEAIENYQQGLAAIRKGGNRGQEILALRALYVAYKQVGDSVRARKFREQYNMVSDSMYDGMGVGSADNRLDEFEKRHNAPVPESNELSYFFLIVIIVVLLAIVAFVAVALHRLSSRQKRLLDSGVVMIASSAAESPGADPESVSARDIEKTSSNRASAFTKPVEGTSTSSPEETARPASAPTASAVSDPEERETARATTMTYAQQKTLLEKINLVMENVSLICREDFNLATLAKAVNSNTKYVSMVINDLCGKTFKTYLNEYRIREACRRITDKENFGNLTIKAIHQELGFRTTTSFVAAFRKVMGMTPSEYKKQHGDPSEPTEEQETNQGEEEGE